MPIHEQDVRISRRMSSSLFGSPRRPKAPQLHTLRLFADRLDLFQVSSLCQQVIDPACLAAVPSSSLLWTIMLVSSIASSIGYIQVCIHVRNFGYPRTGPSRAEVTSSLRRSIFLPRQMAVMQMPSFERTPTVAVLSSLEVPNAVAPPIQVPVG